MIVHLHIGTPKSGTTYLQKVCTRNRQRLADAGVLWSGREWADQVLAVRDVLGLHPGGQETDEAAGAWDRFRREVDAWQGEAVLLSMEWLVHATPEQARAIVDGLAPHEVRVVLTARDLARAVPAQWQEQMQNWATWSWEEYLGAVTADEPLQHDAGRQFWADHDLHRILGTWLDVVPAERVTVVTVPGREQGPDVLWQRFAEVVGLDAAAYDTTVEEGNSSLGAVSAELMRRINVATRASGLEWRLGDPLLKWALAKGVLTARRESEPRLALPDRHHGWAARESLRMADAVGAAGVRVVGSVAELLPPGPPAAPDTAVVSTEQLLEAAIEGIAGLVATISGVAAGQQTPSDVLRAASYVTDEDPVPCEAPAAGAPAAGATAAVVAPVAVVDHPLPVLPVPRRTPRLAHRPGPRSAG